jgi:hypothetical protein
MQRPPRLVLGFLSAGAAALTGCMGYGTISDGPKPGDSPPAQPGDMSRPGAPGNGQQGPGMTGQPPGGSTGGGSSTPAASGPGRLRRLTRAQFANSLRDLLPGGADVALGDLEPDDQRDGFASVGATYAATSPGGVEKYEAAVRAALEPIFADSARRASLFGCSPTDDSCAQAFISGFGKRAWRRPLTPAEVSRYAAVAKTVGTSFGDPARGLQHAALGLLTSPHFLYRVEIGEEAGGRFRYNAWELASRLSFLFWNTTPDAELLTAAESGQLGSTDGVRKQVTRLLGSERAKSGIATFASELFALDDLLMVPKDDERATPSLREAMAAEVRKLFESRLDPGAELTALFDTDKVFANAELAKIYGLAGVTGTDLQAVTLPAGARAGLLGTGAFLTLHSKDALTSPTSRGLFVREALLCQKVPDPPDGVDTTIKDPPAGVVLTRREMLEGHRTNPSCAGCHALFDPIGYAFESFDWVGASRDKDNGKAIDTTGALDGKAFKDARELGTLLRGHPETAKCLVRNFFRFASGHREAQGDEADIAAWTTELGASGNKLVPFLTALAAGESFRNVSPAP